MKNIVIACFILWATLPLRAQPSFPPDVLDLYAELKGRTILRPTTIPRLPASLRSQVSRDKNQAIALIESELAKNHLEVVLDGEKFVRILPEGWRNSPLETQLARIQASAPNGPQSQANSPNKTDETDQIPQGTINLSSVDVNDVLKLYAELRQRTILRPVSLPHAGIKFRSQTVLSREDAAYGLTVVLALNGIAALDDGEKFVQIVPNTTAAQIKSRSPQPDKDSPLLDPRTLPSFQFAPSHVFRIPQRPSQSDSQSALGPPPRIPTGTNSTVDDLVAFYARLAGRAAIPDEHYGKQPILFKALTPLTKTELLYALDTTLALNGFTIARVDDKSVRIEHITERR